MKTLNPLVNSRTSRWNVAQLNNFRYPGKLDPLKGTYNFPHASCLTDPFYVPVFKDKIWNQKSPNPGAPGPHRAVWKVENGAVVFCGILEHPANSKSKFVVMNPQDYGATNGPVHTGKPAAAQLVAAKQQLKDKSAAGTQHATDSAHGVKRPHSPDHGSKSPSPPAKKQHQR